MAGTTSSQLVAILGLPFLSRLYDPAAFGLFATFSVIVTIALSISTLRYDLAIPLTKSRACARVVFNLSFLVLAFSSTLVLVLICIYSYIAKYIGLEAMELTILLSVPLTLLVMGAMQIARSWFVYDLKIKYVFYIQFFGALAGFGLQILCSIIFDGNAKGLVIGQLVGLSISTIFILNVGRVFQYSLNRKFIKYSRLVAVSKRFIELPKNVFQTNFLNSFSNAFLPLLFAIFYNYEIVGIVFLTQKVISFPVSVVSSSIWQLVHSTLPMKGHTERRIIIASIHKFMCLLWFFLLLLVVSLRDLIPIVFGSEWKDMVYIIPAFTVLAMFRSISNSTSYFAVYAEYKSESYWNIFLAVVTIVSVLFGTMFFTEYLAIKFFAGSLALFYFSLNMYWGMKLKLVKSFINNFIKYILPSVFLLLMIEVIDLTIVQRVIVCFLLFLLVSVFGFLNLKNIKKYING